LNREPHTANAASLATSEKSSGESVSHSNESASGPAAGATLRAPGSTAGSVPEISVVVPFWNEELNVVRLADEVLKAFQNESRTLELVLVDDGSSDGTWQQMLQAQHTDPRVRPLRLVCHGGQSAALWAGFTASRGSIIATLDGDLQNDPADLPRMLKELTTYDLVCGLRTKRMDNRVRRISTAVARWARKTALGVDFRDSGCNLRVFKRTVLEKLFPFDGLHRFMPIIAHYAGAQVIETPVQHHARTAGKSKYGVWNRLGRGIWDLIGLAWYRKRRLKNLAATEAPPPKPAASENRP
jgi:dolichol-phosphate mannosyltransferase